MEITNMEEQKAEVKILSKGGIFTQVLLSGTDVSGKIRGFELKQEAGKPPILRLDVIASDICISQNCIPELPDIFKPYYERKNITPYEIGLQVGKPFPGELYDDIDRSIYMIDPEEIVYENCGYVYHKVLWNYDIFKVVSAVDNMTEDSFQLLMNSWRKPIEQNEKKKLIEDLIKMHHLQNNEPENVPAQ